MCLRRSSGVAASGAALVLITLVAAARPGPPAPRPAARAASDPGGRVLLDAHNAYPDQGRWRDRIDRALATGVPIAIEQDLVWHCPRPGRCRSIVSHGEPFTGREPTLDEYFFTRVAPLLAPAVAAGSRDGWPLVTLNLDFKTTEREHLAAIWRVLGRYERYLTTAARLASPGMIAPLELGPLLVLTGDHREQEVVFHDDVPVGGRLRVFGAVVVEGPPAGEPPPGMPPDAIAPRAVLPGQRTNYRRWWNTDWKAVEGGGQRLAGAWTTADAAALQALVTRAHAAGLWLRVYTLNGHAVAESRGWSASYNFGSLDRAAVRWRAAIDAGVDFVATDQYEEFAAVLRGRPAHRPTHLK